MVALSKITREVEVRYTTPGLPEARKEADGFTRTQGQLARATDLLTKSEERSGRSKLTVTEAQARMQRQTEMAVREAQQQVAMDGRLTAANDAVAASFNRAAQAAAENASAVEASARRQAEAAAGAADAQVKTANATKDAAKAANDNGSAMGSLAEVAAGALKIAVEHPIATATAAAAGAKALSGLSEVASTKLDAASLATKRYADTSREMGGRVAGAAAVAADGLSVAAAGASSAAGSFAALSDKLLPTATGANLVVRTLGLLGPLAVPITAAFTAFSVGSIAIDRARADLEKLIAVGKKAEEVDLSAPFLKSFTGLGDKLRVEVEQMEAALKQASTFVRDRYNQANQTAAVFAEIESNGTPLRSARQFDLAQGTEERIRAVLAGMVELEGRGQRLAALDLGEKVFGTALMERLRRGEGSIAKFAADLEDARGKELLRQEDVTRAVAVASGLEDVRRELREATAATADFSSVAVKLDEVWLGVLRRVRDVVVATTESLRGGDAGALRTIQSLQDRIKQTETVGIPIAIGRGDAETVQFLQTVVAGLRQEVDRLSQGLTGATRQIDEAMGRIEPPLRAASTAMEQLATEAEAAKTAIPGLAGALDLVSNAAANAAVQVGSVAAGIRALQGLNPNLSGALGYLDNVTKVQSTYAGTLKAIETDFQKSGDEAAKAKATASALDEQRRALTALAEQRDKPVTSVVREGELAKLGDLDRSIAGISDRFTTLRRDREAIAGVAISKAATPEAAEAIRQQFAAEAAKIDGAQKALVAKARTDAATKAASAADKGGGGSNSFDNAVQRTRDQTDELKLQAEMVGQVQREVYKLTEANRLRRAAEKADLPLDAARLKLIDDISNAYADQRVTTERAEEAQRRLQEGTRELSGEFASFADDVLLSGQKIGDAFDSVAKRLSSGILKALLTGEGPLAGLLGTAPTERGQVGGLLGGRSPFGGGIGSLFSGLLGLPSIGDGLGGDGSAGRALYASPAGPGYAGGGYTGPGGRGDPAGIVHRGEVVWSQGDVARVGGVAVAEAMRRGLPGYVAGGPVGRAPAWMPPPANSGSSDPSGVPDAPIIINTTGQPAQVERINGPRGPRDAIVIGKTVAGAIMSDPDVREALAKAYGIRRTGR